MARIARISIQRINAATLWPAGRDLGLAHSVVGDRVLPSKKFSRAGLDPSPTYETSYARITTAASSIRSSMLNPRNPRHPRSNWIGSDHAFPFEAGIFEI